MEHLGVKSLKEMYERLHIDAAVTVYPKYVGPRLPKGSDVYGCCYRTIRHKTGIYDECFFNLLAACKTLGEVKKHARWETVDMYDYSVIPDQIKGWEDYPV